MALGTLSGVLSACSDSESSGPQGLGTAPPSGDHVSATTLPATTAPSSPPITMPTQDRTLPTFTEGVGMAEWLPFGALDVRAMGYQKAGASGARDSRIDIVTVEECADTGRSTVRHTTWHLVDAAGHTLGVAGGKIVGGHPTEDIPRRLDPPHCIQTRLAIAVPPSSVPVAVKDGSHNTWVLAD